MSINISAPCACHWCVVFQGRFPNLCQHLTCDQDIHISLDQGMPVHLAPTLSICTTTWLSLAPLPQLYIHGWVMQCWLDDSLHWSCREHTTLRCCHTIQMSVVQQTSEESTKLPSVESRGTNCPSVHFQVVGRLLSPPVSPWALAPVLSSFSPQDPLERLCHQRCGTWTSGHHQHQGYA